MPFDTQIQRREFQSPEGLRIFFDSNERFEIPFIRFSVGHSEDYRPQIASMCVESP